MIIMPEMEKYNLLKCIKKGVSPRHTVAYAKEFMEACGFSEIGLQKHWKLERGRGYFASVYESALCAFWIPEDYEPDMPARIAAAHTDWPCLKVKTRPEMSEGRYEKLNVEVYGGPIFYSWFDKPLSLAGIAYVAGEDGPRPVLIDFKRPLAVIPSLAIHYNREVNNSLSLNAQEDLQPVLDVLPKDWKKDGFFTRMVAEEAGVAPEDVLSWDFNFYNMDEPVFFGEHTELLSAPRLDNLTSVQASLSALARVARECRETFCLTMLFDNEEVGSHTKQGADSQIMKLILEKIQSAFHGTLSDTIDAALGGILLSCDVSHALHPNKAQVNDPTHKNYMGDGVAIKMTATQRYATDARMLALAESVCRNRDIPHTSFYNRSDVRGGTTLGPMLSANLGMRAMDLGVPILGMHSARELMAAADQDAITDLIYGLFVSILPK